MSVTATENRSSAFRDDNAARLRWLIVAAIGVLGVCGLQGLLDARSASDRLDSARRDLIDVETKLGQMRRLAKAPRVAALEIESPAEITNRISAARQAAGLPQSSLLSEQPLEPQRIGRTDFELRQTTIELAPSTLPQILAFADALRDEQTGSIVRDLRLSMPGNATSVGVGAGQEKWVAELTLTQMIFSPKASQ